jgi:Type IIA topoisomerase (DNA gyrase/topo II, topoisomerase IV), A subunit
MGSGTVPKRFTLRGALDCFLDFRFETIRRKTAHQLSKVVARAHIVDGLLRALERVDEVGFSSSVMRTHVRIRFHHLPRLTFLLGY